jgi:streptogramin lyase
MFAVPSSVSTQPASINPKGQITGVYFDTSNIAHGFLRDKQGAITTFDVPNAINTYPVGINPRGDITGWYSDAGGVHGFVVRY